MVGVANYKQLLPQLISLLPQGWRHNITPGIHISDNTES